MASGSSDSVPNTNNEELVDAVRHWVHFDNLAETLSKQAANARSLRAEFEEKILTILEDTGNMNAVLKISGASLQREESVKESEIDMSFVQEMLTEYYAKSKKPDETDQIMSFLQKNRNSKYVVGLKKIMNV